MAEKLFQSERESEREEESGSNRTGVKETDFDNRAPVDTIARKRKKMYIPSKNFVRETGWEARNVTNNLLKFCSSSSNEGSFVIRFVRGMLS